MHASASVGLRWRGRLRLRFFRWRASRSFRRLRKLPFLQDRTDAALRQPDLVGDSVLRQSDFGRMCDAVTTNSVSRDPQLPQRQRICTNGMSPRPTATSAARSASFAWWQDLHHTCTRKSAAAMERGVGRFRSSSPAYRAPGGRGCTSPARLVGYRAEEMFDMARYWGGGGGGRGCVPAAGLRAQGACRTRSDGGKSGC
jgi:hypothetical protein